MNRFRRELKAWSKNELIREVERLRAITREMADSPGEPTADLGGAFADVAGDSFARGSVAIDMRHGILMDTVDVCLVDPEPGEPVANERLLLAMLLGGRVNMRDERSQVLFAFDVDGAAAIITQLLGLARRIGPQFADLLQKRFDDLPTADGV